MNINEDYIMRDDLTEENQTTAIEIASGTVWKGVTYRYNAVAFVEDPESGQAKMRFSYDIIEPAGFTENGLREDVGFNNYIGTILNDIILEYVSIPEEVTEDVI